MAALRRTILRWTYRSCALAGILWVALGAAASAQPVLSPQLRDQIAALSAAKAARTPAEQKLASRLLRAERRARGLAPAPGLERLRAGIETDALGRVELDIAGQPGPGLRRRLEALDGEVIASLPERGALRARLALARVRALAAHPEVSRIAPAEHPITRMTDITEGDRAQCAVGTRNALGIDGSGVTVGVLSNGVVALPNLQASGDLPPSVTVLPGQAGGGNEGAAMLEIVHDMAPGADLLFATATMGQANFANNIVALRTAGADVIVDDVGYFHEAVFQDDDVAAAVDQVVADGALYFSSAGNSGNLNDGTSGVFEGDFVPGPPFTGSPPHGAAQPAHDYGGGDIFNEITEDSPFRYTLKWADPLGGSANDYDLYLIETDGTTIVDFSNDTQNGNDDPYEEVLSIGSDTGRFLVVVRYSGADRYLHLNANRGELEHATDGQIWGHAGARGAVAVAAVDAQGRDEAFVGDESVQDYSSDGPRRVFFEADGSAITPGDFSSTGGELRQTPQLAGADCVDTATPGYNTFCGTSAAAPHLAGLAALAIEQAGGPGVADPAAVLQTLENTALDIEAVGFDRDSGWGIAVGEVCLGPPVPVLPGRLAPAWWAGLALVLLGIGASFARRSQAAFAGRQASGAG